MRNAFIHDRSLWLFDTFIVIYRLILPLTSALHKPCNYRCVSLHTKPSQHPMTANQPINQPHDCTDNIKLFIIKLCNGIFSHVTLPLIINKLHVLNR